ncbi:Carbohydrate (keratan sulfate Gal-6) sulfotransferase 1 [Mactra antiquata]
MIMNLCGVRKCKDIFRKNKWTLLIIVWTWVIVSLHLHYFLKNNNKNISRVDESEIHETVKIYEDKIVPEGKVKTYEELMSVKSYDVLLNSYMRGGSTLSGIVLGFRDDVFYLYEPLWKVARWVYWKDNSTICRSDKFKCLPVDAGDTVKDHGFYSNKGSIKGSLVMAQKILRKFYDCQFNDFERQVLETNIAVKLGGPSWRNIRLCMKHGHQEKLCLHKYAPRMCKNATHRVSKVLRLGTGLLGPMLEERKNLKAFHLFRDPRAIINSRINTKWYPSGSKDAILSNAQGLCDRMLSDFREGQKLLQKYPDRFKFLFYEDMVDEPFEKVKAIYRFVGMDLDEKLYPTVKELPVFTADKDQSEREKNSAFWWRKSLEWDVVKGMDTLCKDVYKELGYKSIQSFNDFRNLSISSVDLSRTYMLDIR